MKKIFSLLIFAGLVIPASAQVAVGGGASLLKSFGSTPAYGGMHLLVEVPTDDQTSYYGKLGIFLKNKQDDGTVSVEAIDPSVTFPVIQVINKMETFNYTTLEGGRRYYFGNGYDYGFSAYGGTHFMLAFNRVTQSTDAFDDTKYRLPDGAETQGNIFNLALGLSGGVKNTFTFGTLYFDVSLDYFLASIPSNSVAQNTGMYSPLLFTFSLGYKKDIF